MVLDDESTLVVLGETFCGRDTVVRSIIYFSDILGFLDVPLIVPVIARVALY